MQINAKHTKRVIEAGENINGIKSIVVQPSPIVYASEAATLLPILAERLLELPGKDGVVPPLYDIAQIEFNNQEPVTIPVVSVLACAAKLPDEEDPKHLKTIIVLPPSVAPEIRRLVETAVEAKLETGSSALVVDF